MVIAVTQTGNSKGIQFPNEVIEQCKISDKVELEIVGTSIILKPTQTTPRQGWNEAFQQMHNNGSDKLLVDDVLEMQSLI